MAGYNPQILTALTAQILVVCPIFGVSIGDITDKATWVVDYDPAATGGQRTAAAAVVTGFDTSLYTTNASVAYHAHIDCSANPNYPAGNLGDSYLVTVAGKIGGSAGPRVNPGDLATCNANGATSGTHAAVGSNWNVTAGLNTAFSSGWRFRGGW